MDTIKQSSISMPYKYFDIGVNLIDSMYQGTYNGKQYHQCDVEAVLHRAEKFGVQRMLLTGSSIHESVETIKLAHDYEKSYSFPLYYTIGVHPCCVNEFVTDGVSTIDKVAPVEYSEELLEKTKNLTKVKLQQLLGGFKSIGEIGLDYDRLHYSDWNLQKWFFEQQLKLACILNHNIKTKADSPKAPLPLFLHMRNCCDEFIEILQKFITGFQDTTDFYNYEQWAINKQDNVQPTSFTYKFPENQVLVVHSYTDGPDHVSKLLNLSPNVYIGFNGCSLRTPESIATVEKVDLARVLVETDAPWCEIKKSSASFGYVTESVASLDSNIVSVKKDKYTKKLQDMDNTGDNIMVKGRNEPCNVNQVVQVISKIKNLAYHEVANTIWETSLSIYEN
ncbi:hypothetical protein ACO0QE_004269 [Hanseniaspora vineae]